MRTDDLDFDLPADRVAVAPAHPRDSARLLVCHRNTGRAEDHHVRDLPDLGVLDAGDVMAVNRTRVVPARFSATRAATGGKVDGLFLGPEPPQPGACTPDLTTEADTPAFRLLCHSGGRLQPGEQLDLPDGSAWRLIDKRDAGVWRATFLSSSENKTTADPLSALKLVGRPPLPPYILQERKARGLPQDDPQDPERYNTVFAGRNAQDTGSAAAPTAGLHFTPELMDRLSLQGVRRAEVVLHVGLGTFAPVRSDSLDDHTMHSESYLAPAETLDTLRRARSDGRCILAVGTTTVRALESLPPDWANLTEDYASQTDLFIRPDTGFGFRLTDALLTNFHLPKSTLLAMVAALPGVGVPRLLEWYRLAVERNYRFYSFGDAMLIV
ncbi:MAG: tRNA preQ1(34) S-adenosylmethionine ribosyltransferase-isomerase QueA [Planctomycetota bacterium]